MSSGTGHCGGKVQAAPFPLRLAPGTRARLEALAVANGRPLNTQIALILEDFLQAGGFAGVPAMPANPQADGFGVVQVVCRPSTEKYRDWD